MTHRYQRPRTPHERTGRGAEALKVRLGVHVRLWGGRERWWWWPWMVHCYWFAVEQVEDAESRPAPSTQDKVPRVPRPVGIGGRLFFGGYFPDRVQTVWCGAVAVGGSLDLWLLASGLWSPVAWPWATGRLHDARKRQLCLFGLDPFPS